MEAFVSVRKARRRVARDALATDCRSTRRPRAVEKAPMTKEAGSETGVEIAVASIRGRGSRKGVWSTRATLSNDARQGQAPATKSALRRTALVSNEKRVSKGKAGGD